MIQAFAIRSERMYVARGQYDRRNIYNSSSGRPRSFPAWWLRSLPHGERMRSGNLPTCPAFPNPEEHDQFDADPRGFADCTGWISLR